MSALSFTQRCSDSEFLIPSIPNLVSYYRVRIVPWHSDRAENPSKRCPLRATDRNRNDLDGATPLSSIRPPLPPCYFRRNDLGTPRSHPPSTLTDRTRKLNHGEAPWLNVCGDSFCDHFGTPGTMNRLPPPQKLLSSHRQAARRTRHTRERNCVFAVIQYEQLVSDRNKYSGSSS